MRVLEIGVQELGVKLGVVNPQEKTWGNILNEIRLKINAMPSNTRADKEVKEKYSAAYALLVNVKDAWRNTTMHPKSTYTEEEAMTLFDASRAFMGHLLAVI